MILESDIQQIAEICGSAIRPDRLDGGAVKTFVEPVIIVVFRYRRTGDHGIVVKVLQRACALVFLVCQNCLQSRQGLVILVKKYFKNLFAMIKILLKIKVNKGADLREGNNTPAEENNDH